MRESATHGMTLTEEEEKEEEDEEEEDDDDEGTFLGYGYIIIFVLVCNELILLSGVFCTGWVGKESSPNRL